MREMKDSGISWVGEIPKEWTIMPLYCFYSERKNKNIFGVENNLLSLSYGKVIRKDINTSEGLLPSNYNGSLTGEAGAIIIPATDLHSYKPRVRTGLSKERGIITSAYIALKPKNEINSRFYHYLLHTYDILKVFYNMGNGVRQGLNYDEFAKLMVYSPSDTEQQKIAEFLDRECGKIDGLKADIQAQIDTLEQYKRSIITEAVTHGLNPSAPMKECSVSWARQIPQHWKVMPNKHLMTKIKNICPIYKGEDILSLTMYGVIVRDLDAGGKMPSSFDGYQYIKKGNLLMCLFDIDVTPRCIGIIKQSGITSPAYSQFKMKKIANARFYYYYYLMLDYTKELLHLAKNLRHSLTEDQLGAIKQLVPPIDEQQEIADYLDNKCAEIEQIIADKKSQIETLDGYKKSLIYEYVTGKKEVV